MRRRLKRPRINMNKKRLNYKLELLIERGRQSLIKRKKLILKLRESQSRKRMRTKKRRKKRKKRRKRNKKRLNDTYIY